VVLKTQRKLDTANATIEKDRNVGRSLCVLDNIIVFSLFQSLYYTVYIFIHD
jgi:hypothetical protein